MFVVGRVLDPSGKEMAGVPVEIVGRPREPFLPSEVDAERHRLLGRGASNADGRFNLEASRTSFTRFFEVYALAAAPGFGLGWSEINADAAEPTVEIRLQSEQPIRGRLFDVNALPARGVELHIASVGRPSGIGTFDGVNLGVARLPQGVRNWPRPVTTDNEGRFSLAGIGRNVLVMLSVNDSLRQPEHGASRPMISACRRTLFRRFSPRTSLRDGFFRLTAGNPWPARSRS